MKKILYLISFIILLLSPFLGEINISIQSVLIEDSFSYTVFWQLRLPRLFLAFFVGGILSLSGFVFQIIFKNALITPYTLGIASGTTFFTALGIVFFPTVYLSISSIGGSLVTILVLFFISKKLHKNSISVSTNSILLIGIALSYFYGAGLMLVFYLSNLQENYSIVRFTLGSLDTVGFTSSVIVVIVALFFYMAIVYNKSNIKLLLLNNDMAFLKGLNVNKVSLSLLVIVSLSVGISISFVGPIGFVGLVIPHIIKIIYKKSSYRLFFPVFYFGGVFLVFADLISRNLPTDSILPIGVVTAFIGAPFFIIIKILK